MRIHAGFLLAALLTASCAKAETPASDTQAAATPETPASDAKAIAIADQVMEGLGGKKHWESLRGIRWTFGNSVGDTVKSSRRHSWDKQTGWHRVSGKNRAGQAFVVIENLNDGKGMAWMEGNRIEGDSLAKLLTFAKRTWTNDTYWFLMPYKLRDPGVVLRDQGTVTRDGRAYRVLGLSFEQVGETPGDRYTVFVNPANSRIEAWEYVLQGTQPPPTAWTWEGWEQRDGMWFPTAHMNPDRTRNVFTRDVEAVHAFGPSEFTAP